MVGFWFAKSPINRYNLFMKLYNTLGREKQEFKPLKKGKVLMYHCGPTVYWTQHIGNMRGMVMADLIRRSFEYQNYQVKFVRNYTDVGHLTSDSDTGEDKMERAAKRDNLSPDQIAEKYIKIFETDTQELNIQEPNFKPRATQMIPEIIAMVQTLLDKGFAYATDLAVYFDISKAKDYTKLSGQKMEKNIADAGKGDVSDDQKKNSADFALWFFKAGVHEQALQFWPSPFHSGLVENGNGFPGWHIECSAMIKKFLGDTIDIHMGGIEHVPVHHTNEIAQSEAANGVEFVRYWLHNEHLTVDNKKMAKSEGTSYALADVKEKGFSPMALRYFFLSAHYRSKQNFTWESLEASKTAYEKLTNFLNEKQIDNSNITDYGLRITDYQNNFISFITDDFNIPATLAMLWEIIKDNVLPYSEKKKLLLDFDKVWGLCLDNIKPKENIVPENILELANKRQSARENKDWQKADQLRQQVEKLGYKIKDQNKGFDLIKL